MKKKEKKDEGKEEEIGVKREACERESETCFIKQILFFFFTILLQWTTSLLSHYSWIAKLIGFKSFDGVCFLIF